MADRANLTKIEFGILSTEAERRYINLEPLSLGVSRRNHRRAHRRTGGSTHGWTDRQAEAVNSMDIRDFLIIH